MKTILILALLILPATQVDEKLVEVVCKDGSVHVETMSETEFECEWKELRFF